MIGIYKITNKINGKVYIGETTNIEERWIKHKKDLKNNIHHSYKLQNDWNLYGESNFIFEVILEIKTYSNPTNLKCFLIISEYKFIEKYNSISNGYNIENTYEKIKCREDNIFKDKNDSNILYYAFIDIDRILNINKHIKDEEFVDGLMPIEDFVKNYFQYRSRVKSKEKCFETIRHILRMTNKDYEKYSLARYDFNKYVILKNGKYYVKKEIKSEAIDRWIYFNINCDSIYEQKDKQKEENLKIKKENKKQTNKCQKYYNNKCLSEILSDIDKFEFNDKSIKVSSFCDMLNISKNHFLNLIKDIFNLGYLKEEEVRVLTDEFENVKRETLCGNNEIKTYNTIICKEESKQFIKNIIIKDFNGNIK